MIASSSLCCRAHRRGAMVLLVAVVLPILLLMAVLAVNVAYMELTRVELRTATDAAAEAGSRTLSLTGDQTEAVRIAKEAAARNLVAREPLLLDDADIEFGMITRPSSTSRFDFTPNNVDWNAVRVNGRRTEGSLSGPVSFAFGAMGVHEFEPRQHAVAGQTDRDICLVLDRSGSMAMFDDDGNSTEWDNGDPAPGDSRWMRVSDAAKAFCNAVTLTPMEELVSLATYSSSASIDHDLTLNYTLIHTRLDGLATKFDGGYTNVADGIEKGRQCLVERGFERRWAEPTIVVMTDGKHNTGDIEPEDAATTAASHGITIHTITYGHDAEQTRMQEVAKRGNGRHWHAPDAASLLKAFNEIAANSPTMLIE